MRSSNVRRRYDYDESYRHNDSFIENQNEKKSNLFKESNDIDKKDPVIPVSSTTKVKVEVPNLNIRKGPGKDYDRTGKFTGSGVFEITEKKPGKGSEKGWGKLVSEEGWISLDFCEVL